MRRERERKKKKQCISKKKNAPSQEMAQRADASDAAEVHVPSVPPSPSGTARD